MSPFRLFSDAEIFFQQGVPGSKLGKTAGTGLKPLGGRLLIDGRRPVVETNVKSEVT